MNILTVQSKNPATAKKEKLLRPFGLLIFVAVLLSFISTFVVFHNTWTLLSTPTVLFIVLILATLNLFLLISNKIDLSGILMIVLIIFALLGMIYNDSYNYYVVPYVLSVIVLLVALLWSRKFIFPVTIGMLIVIFAIATLQYPLWVTKLTDFPNPLENLTRNLVVLVVAYLVWVISEK